MWHQYHVFVPAKFYQVSIHEAQWTWIATILEVSAQTSFVDYITPHELCAAIARAESRFIESRRTRKPGSEQEGQSRLHQIETNLRRLFQTEIPPELTQINRSLLGLIDDRRNRPHDPIVQFT